MKNDKYTFLIQQANMGINRPNDNCQFLKWTGDMSEGYICTCVYTLP